AIRRERLGDRHPDVATSLSSLAGLYQLQGRYGEAEPLYQESLAIRRERLGDRHPDVATSLNNLAGLYPDQGRYGEAEPLYQESLAISREQLGDRHPAVAASLGNLAVLYQLQGRYEEAEPLYQESLAIRRERLGDRHPAVATSLNNLAGLYRDQGRYGEAERLYQESLAIRREQLGDRHPAVAISLGNLAGLYQAQGRYGEADPLFQESLAILQAQLGEHHPNVAISLNNMAVLYQALGNTTQAISFLRQGLGIEEYQLDTNFASLAEAQRQDYAAQITATTEVAISLNLNQAPDSPAATQLALTTLLRRKGRILDATTNSLQTLRQNLTPADQAVLDELTTIQTQLSALIFNPPGNLPPEQYTDELDRLEAEADDLNSTLARRSAVFRAETQPITLEAVQAKLPQDAVLVEFTRYQPYDATNPSDRWGEARYAAYLLSPSGDIQAIDLGDAAAIDNAIQAFSTLLQDPRADLRGASIVQEIRPEFVEDVTGTLKTLILDPIAPYLQGHQHLLISPDSQLNRLPFEALQTDNSQYLVEQYQISYLNSGRDLLKFGVLEPSTQPAVIVANPNYGPTAAPRRRSESDATLGLEDLQFDPLPGTAEEVAALRPILPNATILTEASATENALKQTQNPRILHIATHGFFLTDAPRPEPEAGRGLTFSGDGLRASGTASAPVENPLLRSGLALAGFNTRTSGDEDGAFTALEAANLNLYGTQLVVLSACDTGLGDIANGEGVYGLRRAFGIAGAETQLISLWQVSDYGTQSLMARYYQNLMAGMGRSEALRDVQLAMIHSDSDYAHPYYWAAFVLA
ncbi:MAG: CHAT domain-containing tetratricopeptide repeat protein, partial [Nodosilinea sp.]